VAFGDRLSLVNCLTQAVGEKLGSKKTPGVVTGAGGGIGHAGALGMAEAGVPAVLLDQNEEGCQAAAVWRPQRVGGGTLLELVGNGSRAQLTHKSCPAIQDRQNGFPLIGIEADDAPCDAELLITLQRPDLVRCESVELFGIEANSDRACGPVTSGGGKHVLKLRDERELITVFFASQCIPTVSLLNGAA